MAVTLTEVHEYMRSPEFADYVKYSIIDSLDESRTFALLSMYRKQIRWAKQDAQRANVKEPTVFVPSSICGMQAEGSILGMRFKAAPIQSVIVGYELETP